MNFSRATIRRPRGALLNLAGMIDVTFLLLVYFMATTVIAPREDRLTARVEAEGAADTSLQPQRVEVRHAQGAPLFVIGAHRLADGDALVAVLERLPREAGVTVIVSADIPVAWAFKAVQAAQDAGYDSVMWESADVR